MDKWTAEDHIFEAHLNVLRVFGEHAHKRFGEKHGEFKTAVSDATKTFLTVVRDTLNALEKK